MTGKVNFKFCHCVIPTFFFDFLLRSQKCEDNIEDNKRHDNHIPKEKVAEFL